MADTPLEGGRLVADTSKDQKTVSNSHGALLVVKDQAHEEKSSGRLLIA